MMVYPLVIIQFDHIVKCQKKIIVESFKGIFNNCNDPQPKQNKNKNETKAGSLVIDLNILLFLAVEISELFKLLI